MIKITPRDEEIISLLRQGLGGRDIALELDISEAVVKKHIETLTLRAGITGPGKRIRLLNLLDKSALNFSKLEKLTPEESAIAILVCEGKSNKEICAELNITSDQVLRNRLSATFDAIGAWSRLELRNMLTISPEIKKPVHAVR